MAVHRRKLQVFSGRSGETRNKSGQRTQLSLRRIRVTMNHSFFPISLFRNPIRSYTSICSIMQMILHLCRYYSFFPLQVPIGTSLNSSTCRRCISYVSPCRSALTGADRLRGSGCSCCEFVRWNDLELGLPEDAGHLQQLSHGSRSNGELHRVDTGSEDLQKQRLWEMG